MTKKNINNVVIYRAASGAIELRGDKKGETVWASQAQIAEVFSVERSVVTKHIRNIFKDDELDEKSNMQKMHIPNSALTALTILVAESNSKGQKQSGSTHHTAPLVAYKLHTHNQKYRKSSGVICRRSSYLYTSHNISFMTQW